MYSLFYRRYCSSTESFQCKEKKQDGNALRAVNIAKASEETGNRFTRRYHHCQDTWKIRHHEQMSNIRKCPALDYTVIP
ncbi:hypothetical protein T03_12733 [Trichinella britovi]|uniref:Uncharacterized protein n=1 Tax=Trichinella britovi TaxID=45882 RepID=A0A0V1C3Q4_TRIBR|nr:hypothetical protein T03_12733 [Trichinella britovi]